MERGTFRPVFVDWEDYYSSERFPVFPDYKLLAEGDSWFTISGFPIYNLLFELRFRKQTMIVNCGTPGDTIKHMAQISKNRILRQAVSRGGVQWDAILLSGGGNDLIDMADEIILDKDQRPPASAISAPEDYCDKARLRSMIRTIQNGYRTIAALRDTDGSPNADTPIITHTYDYATPRNSPAKFFGITLGPWLYTALVSSKVPKKHWIAVSKYLIDTLGKGILALTKGARKIENFHVVDTRGTLDPAKLGETGPTQDWQNEIHPNGNGYEKLAKMIEPDLDRLLGEISD